MKKERPVLTLKQASDYLNVSERTLRRQITEGKIAPVRIGRRLLFQRAELDRFLSESVQRPLAA